MKNRFKSYAILANAFIIFFACIASLIWLFEARNPYIEKSFLGNSLFGFSWNFEVIDLFFFAIIGCFVLKCFHYETVPILLFAYGFSEFISYGFEKILIQTQLVNYSNQYPANDFPANPFFLAAVAFCIIVFTQNHAFKISIIRAIVSATFVNFFVVFLFCLSFFGIWQLWITHPIAYALQLGIILPFFRRVELETRSNNSDSK